MFNNINQLVINDSLADKTYLLIVITIIGGYLIYTIFSLIAINLYIQKLKKAKKLIEEGHKKYTTAKYFGKTKWSERVIMEKQMSNVPSEEDRKFLFS